MMWLPRFLTGGFIKHVVTGISSTDYVTCICKLSPSAPFFPTYAHPRSHATMHCCLIDLSLEVCLFITDLCTTLTTTKAKEPYIPLILGIAILLGLIGLALLQGLQPLQSGHWSQSSTISHLILTCTMTPWNPVPCVKVSDTLFFMWLYIFFSFYYFYWSIIVL